MSAIAARRALMIPTRRPRVQFEGGRRYISAMKIAIAQINCTVGDLAGNVARIAEVIERARAQSADLLVTPELALCGYPPEDLLLRDDFYRNCDAALQDLA